MVVDIREGPGPPSLIFRPNWGLKGQLHPPLSKGLDDRRPRRLSRGLNPKLRTPEFLKSLWPVLVGLVDTAVKTAETGYMQRRLVKVSCLFPLKMLSGGSTWGLY